MQVLERDLLAKVPVVTQQMLTERICHHLIHVYTNPGDCHPTFVLAGVHAGVQKKRCDPLSRWVGCPLLLSLQLELFSCFFSLSSAGNSWPCPSRESYRNVCVKAYVWPSEKVTNTSSRRRSTFVTDELSMRPSDAQSSFQVASPLLLRLLLSSAAKPQQRPYS